MATQAGNIAVKKGNNGETTDRPVPIETGWDHPVRYLREELNRTFDRFFQDTPEQRGRAPSLFNFEPFNLLGSGARWPAMQPDTDVEETDKAYVISAELPGIDDKDIDLTLKDNVLTLKGEKKSERKEKKKDYHLTERQYGSFRRSFRLPSDVDDKKINADFIKGVLKITLPKSASAQAKQRKIGIKAK